MSHNPPTKIILDTFILRKLKKTDTPAITKHITKDIVRYTINIPYPYKKRNALAFITFSRKNWHQRKAIIYGIEINNEIAGICSIEHIDNINHKATLGYWLAKEHWGKKITSQAAQKVVEIAFNILKIHRLEVEHFEENIASQKIIQKLGFQLEGTKRDAFYRENKWHNILYYSRMNTK